MTLLWSATAHGQEAFDAGVDVAPPGAASAVEASHSPAEASTIPPPPVPEAASAPSFASDPFGAVAAATDLVLKMYGDTGVSVRNNADQAWLTATGNANVYGHDVNMAFFAPRLDIFGSANIDRLSFLTEVMFEAKDNSMGLDLERLQLAYLFSDWLRVKAGRSHMAWGYYNDTYHHGNIFELSTSRPYSVNFEDSFGIVVSHAVGVGVDGAFTLGETQWHYDLEIANPRPPDITGVAVQFADGKSPTLNARLRWMPLDGLILGINGMRGVIPSLQGEAPTAGGAAPVRPDTEELVGGAHVVYTEHHFTVDVEGFYMRHNPSGGESKNIYGGFAECGYAIGEFTPYIRPEYIRFPSGGDPIYQFVATDPQGMVVGGDAIYAGVKEFFDFRFGIKWLVMPQLALKLEGNRVSRDGQHQEIATVKAAFGF